MVSGNESLFWSLNHPDRKPLFVLGTIHVRDSQILSWIEETKSNWIEVEALALELDLEERSFRPIRPSPYKLSEYLSEKKYHKLRRIFLKAFDFDIQQFDQLHPLFISQIMAETFFDQTSDPSVDLFLWQIGQELDLHLFGLETWEQQINVLDRIPYETQVKQLLEIGRNIRKVPKQVLKLKRYYFEQNIKSLYHAAKRQLGKMRKIMLYDRNVILAQRIAEINQEHSLLAGIGAAHLWGEKGVLRMLKKDGYRLKPVFIPIAH